MHTELEQYLATTLDTTKKDVSRSAISAIEVALYQLIAKEMPGLIDHSTDMNELSFSMSEKYSLKKLDKAARAFRIKVSIDVEELSGHRK